MRKRDCVCVKKLAEEEEEEVQGLVMCCGGHWKWVRFTYSLLLLPQLRGSANASAHEGFTQFSSFWIILFLPFHVRLIFKILLLLKEFFIIYLVKIIKEI